MNEPGDGVILDLGKLLALMIRRLPRILLCCLLAAGISVGGSWLLVPVRYQSAAVFYVSNAQQVENLEDSFGVVLKSRQTLMEVIRVTGIEKNHTQLGQMIRTAPLQETHFFRVVVTGADPYEARDLALAISEVLPQRIETIMEGTRAVVADEAILETDPVGPDYGAAAILGGLCGLCLGICSVLLQVVLPQRVNKRR